MSLVPVALVGSAPILPPSPWVNHSLPSGPIVMSPGSLIPVGPISVTLPPGVIFPIRLPAGSVNTRPRPGRGRFHRQAS